MKSSTVLVDRMQGGPPQNRGQEPTFECFNRRRPQGSQGTKAAVETSTRGVRDGRRRASRQKVS